jgi:hypothetical protein
VRDTNQSSHLRNRDGACPLDAIHEMGKLPFCVMATQLNPAALAGPIDDPLRELEFPQREAAFFYGLFLRGHSLEELRRDIEVPAAVLAKWDRETLRQPEQRITFERMAEYRRHVLAIFDSLVRFDSSSRRLQ